MARQGWWIMDILFCFKLILVRIFFPWSYQLLANAKVFSPEKDQNLRDKWVCAYMDVNIPVILTIVVGYTYDILLDQIFCSLFFFLKTTLGKAQLFFSDLTDNIMHSAFSLCHFDPAAVCDCCAISLKAPPLSLSSLSHLTPSLPLCLFFCLSLVDIEENSFSCERKHLHVTCET